MMRHFVALVAIATTLCSCQTTPAAAPKTRAYTLSYIEADAIMRKVRASLKDPDSAKFNGMRAATHGGGITYVCGLVNAKNSFGGYTGDQIYFGMLGTLNAGDKQIAIFTVHSLGENITASLCKQHGAY